MKMTGQILFLFFLAAFLLSCNNEPEKEYIPPSDPAEAILGKWELIAKGFSLDNMVYEKPFGYYLFGKDNTLTLYSYDDNRFLRHGTYQIDSLLHHLTDGSITHSYKYTFTGNKLTLEKIYSSWWTFVDEEVFYIYQRKD